MRGSGLLVVLAVGLAAPGCTGGDGDDGAQAPERPASARLSEVAALRAKTPRTAVLKRIGEPYTNERMPEVTSNVAACYRWRLETDGGELDAASDLRLCFNEADRLTAVMTAPREP